MTELETLTQAIALLEAQRATLGDSVVEAALAPLRAKLAALQAPEVGQRKQVTVLFCTVSGFTALSETLEAAAGRATLQTLWAKLDNVITLYGGQIDKHSGEAVMALWGTHHAREDDAERAIKAALAVQKMLGDWHPEHGASISSQSSALAQSPISSLQIRIGLNTGPVWLGVVGSTHEFTAMGDTVNVAARLEQAAPNGGILIAHDTYRQVRGVFDVLAQPPLLVKGKTEPLQVYLVERLKPHAFRQGSRGVEGIATPLVGRTPELAQLQAAWRVVLTEQRLQTVFVVADAGLGKSRLLYEFHHWLETSPNWANAQHFPQRRFGWLRGRATQAMRQVPYSLLREVLFRRFQIQEDEPLELAHAKLVAGVQHFLPTDAQAEEKAHFLGHLVGLDVAASPYLRGILHDAQQIRDRAFHYLAQLLAGAAQVGQDPSGRRPVALYVDDVQWADEGSLAALAYLAERCRALPLLLLGLTRPVLFEQHPDWGHTWLDVRVHLNALTPTEGRALVDAILQRAPAVPESLRAQLVAQAEGNPFYLEELIKMLIDEKVLRPAEPAWEVALERLTHLKIPPTLTGVLQARLDTLPPAERETLQRAAVIGRVFWAQAVAALGVPNAGVPAAVTLTALQQRELIFARATSAFAATDEYLFKHALLREVTYETVLKKLRRVYHAQAATWLETHSGARAEEFAALIAEHYELAGNLAPAAHWHGRAGDQARVAYAPETAMAHYQKALALHPTPPLAWYAGLGEVCRTRARHAEALAAFAKLLALGEQAGDLVAQAQACNWASLVNDALGQNHAALAEAQRAATLARAASTAGQLELANALYNQGWAQFRLGESGAAITCGQQAVALATALGDPARLVLADSLKLLGAVHAYRSEFDEATDYTHRALLLCRALKNRERESAMLNNLGALATQRGEDDTAIARYQEALTIAREIGSRTQEWMYLNNWAGVRAEKGDYAAEADLRQLIAWVGNTQAMFLPYTYYCLAQICLAQGRRAEAQAAAAEALALAQAGGSKFLIGLAWRINGQVASQQAPAPTAAAAYFANSLQLFNEVNMQAEQARTLQAWAQHERAQGDPAAGEKMWGEARALFAELGLSHELARMAAQP